jgi:hypothetical protein
MFQTLRKSFGMARTSYGIVACYPTLALLPVLSSLAGVAILASFLVSVWQTGVLAEQDAGGAPTEDPVLIAEVFLFYFASYLSVVFFNVALVVCTQQALTGDTPRLRDGIAGAIQRLPSIIVWSLLSAVIGVLLRCLERASPKIGVVVAALFGLSWTALTFFVVPVLVVESHGAIGSVRRSGEVLRAKWGEAVIGGMSVGWIGLMIALPPLFLAFLVAGAPLLGDAAFPAAFVIGGMGVLVATAASSAADTIFKLLLYRQATNQTIPDGIDPGVIAGPA